MIIIRMASFQTLTAKNKIKLKKNKKLIECFPSYGVSHTNNFFFNFFSGLVNIFCLTYTKIKVNI